MTEVFPRLKPWGVCPCDDTACGREGFYQAAKRKDGLQHVRACSCRRCKFKRVRKGGQDAQRDAAKRAGVKKVGTIFAGHEELYDGPTRIEIKSGAQVKPIVTAFDKHREQSDASRRIGDTRPFVLHVKPTPGGKRQLTTFESNSDEEYRQTVYSIAAHAGVEVP